MVGQKARWGLVVITVFVNKLLAEVVVDTAVVATGNKLLACIELSKVSWLSARTLVPSREVPPCLVFLDLRFLFGVEVFE